MGTMKKLIASILVTSAAVFSLMAVPDVKGLPSGGFSSTFNIEIKKPPTNKYYVFTGIPTPGRAPAPAPNSFNIQLIENNPSTDNGHSPILPHLDFGVWFEASAPGSFMFFFASRDDLGDDRVHLNPYMLTLETDKTYGLNYNITGTRHDLNEQEDGFTEVKGSIPFTVENHTDGKTSSSPISPVNSDKPFEPTEDIPYQPKPCVFGYTNAPGVMMPTIQTGAVFIDRIDVPAGDVKKGYYDFHLEIPYPKDKGSSVMFRSGFYKGYVIAHFKPDV